MSSIIAFTVMFVVVARAYCEYLRVCCFTVGTKSPITTVEVDILRMINVDTKYNKLK
jgi:hypothetical protein